MLENSYDASGIKFGIMLSNTLHSKGEIIRNSNNANAVYRIMDEIISSKETSIIDFSQVDGLTVGEVSEMSKAKQAKDCVVFVMYSNIQEGPETIYKCVYTYLFINNNKELRDMPIDEAVENYYITNYLEENDAMQKMIKCFLQRYRYGTKERTDEILKEKVYKK